jgi:hypothetical protein
MYLNGLESAQKLHSANFSRLRKQLIVLHLQVSHPVHSTHDELRVNIGHRVEGLKEVYLTCGLLLPLLLKVVHRR